MSPDELREAFRQREVVLEAFGQWVTERVVAEVRRLVGAPYSSSFFRIAPIPRVKAVESFIEKATSGRKVYKDPLNDITDQVGTRFVVLLHDECLTVNLAIESVADWIFDKAKDIESVRDLNPHHFDYESYHWTVSPKKEFKANGILIPVETTCEIQVRTLLQHAYAELAHSTVYKRKTAAKPSVQRIIARGAALIETTDCVFREVAARIAEASGAQDSLLASASAWYAQRVKPGEYPPSGVAQRIADAYSDQLSGVDWSTISGFLESKTWLPAAIKEERFRPLFDDPVITLVFWLVSELRHDVYDSWPYDSSVLRTVFTKLGIANE